jgi:hypothetical protein
MKITNSIGPKILPCGTPEVTGAQLETAHRLQLLFGIVHAMIFANKAFVNL